MDRRRSVPWTLPACATITPCCPDSRTASWQEGPGTPVGWPPCHLGKDGCTEGCACRQGQRALRCGGTLERGDGGALEPLAQLGDALGGVGAGALVSEAAELVAEQAMLRRLFNVLLYPNTRRFFFPDKVPKSPPVCKRRGKTLLKCTTCGDNSLTRRRSNALEPVILSTAAAETTRV
eukprot:scaffold32264_cov52-Phaeocystis_antarctica.AAC.1